MYISLKKEDFLKRYALSEDYHVDRVLVFGSFKNEYYEICKKHVIAHDPNARFSFLEAEFLSPILEVSIQGKVMWFMVAYGGARLSEWLHIANVFGNKATIFLGTCGGLLNFLKSGDIVIPTESFAEESSAKGYSALKHNIHKPNLAFQSSFAKSIGVDVKSGKIVTHQAMLGETWEDIVAWSQLGYSAVEMESATVFAVSEYFNVPAAAALIVADNLIQKQTVFDSTYESEKTKRTGVQELLFEKALDVLLNSEIFT